MYYPALTTAALFTAIIIADSIQQKVNDIGRHALLGFICVLIMLILSEKGAEFVAWGLLFLPMLIILISYIVALRSQVAKSNSTLSLPTPAQMPTPMLPIAKTVQTPCGTVPPIPASTIAQVQPNPAAVVGCPAPAPFSDPLTTSAGGVITPPTSCPK